MENRLKRVFTGIISFLLFSFCFALPNNFRLSVEPVYSLKNGTLFEYVYAHDEISNSDVKMSELDWPLTNISCSGGSIGAGWKFIQLDAEFTGAVSKRTGTMEDFDWLDCYESNNKYYYKNSALCTNKSISETTLNSNNNFNIKLSFDINPVWSLHVIPSVGYEYNYYSFSARNGYGWYGDKTSPKVAYTDPNALYFPKGELYGIDYEREKSNVYTGAEVKYILNDKFQFSICGNLSIYTNVQSIDFHHHNAEGTYGDYYLDIMEGYFKQFSIGAAFEANIWKGLSAAIDFGYTNLSQLTGITYKSNEKKFYKHNLANTTSRCAEEIFNISTGVKYTF